MKFLHTMLRVSDLDKNIDFFCNKLGLHEYSRTEHEGGRFTLIFLCADEDKHLADENKAPLIELTYNWPTDNEKVEEYRFERGFGHLAFRVNDIYQTCEDLQNKGVTINRPPRDGRMAFIKSPEGASIELLQNGDALIPASPWSEMKNVGSW
jgi:lactoylglutathione lyase